MMRAWVGWIVSGALGLVLGLALGAPSHASGPASGSINCRHGSELVTPGRSMCLDGFTTVCRPNGAWGVDRHAPCFVSGTRTACQISTYELAAPGARTCMAGRLRQCSERGEWIDLAGSC